MRAVVIGTGWGLTHVYALRKIGVEVVGIAARQTEKLQETAYQHQIPHFCKHAGEIENLNPDLVCVASPTETHIDWINEFPDVPVICEKPLSGKIIQTLETRSAPLFVNYSYPYLPAAKQFAACLEQCKKLESIQIDCLIGLDKKLTAIDAVFEISSHLLAFAMKLLEVSPKTIHIDIKNNNSQIHFMFGKVKVILNTLQEQQSGISQRIMAISEQEPLIMQASFRPNRHWFYQPIFFPRKKYDFENAEDEQDPWIKANEDSIAAIVSCLKGYPPHENLTTQAKASALDHAILDAFLQTMNKP